MIVSLIKSFNSGFAIGIRIEFNAGNEMVHANGSQVIIFVYQNSVFAIAQCGVGRKLRITCHRQGCIPTLTQQIIQADAWRQLTDWVEHFLVIGVGGRAQPDIHAQSVFHNFSAHLGKQGEAKEIKTGTIIQRYRNSSAEKLLIGGITVLVIFCRSTSEPSPTLCEENIFEAEFVFNFV
ncbi:hypothetical protein DSECCO2_538870 [anaerobic digester metagenome]